MHIWGGDWSAPRRLLKSKKKLRRCWVFRWRRQTATTCHDGRDRLFGTKAGSDRRRLRGHQRVARQRLPREIKEPPWERSGFTSARPFEQRRQSKNYAE